MIDKFYTDKKIVSENVGECSENVLKRRQQAKDQGKRCKQELESTMSQHKF